MADLNCKNLFLLPRDIHERLHDNYLQKHSISIALLRRTCRAVRQLYSRLEFVVSPKKLDGCSLDIMEQVLPPIANHNIDSYHWDHLFTNAVTSNNMNDIKNLLGCFFPPSKVLVCSVLRPDDTERLHKNPIVQQFLRMMDALPENDIKNVWQSLPCDCVRSLAFTTAVGLKCYKIVKATFCLTKVSNPEVSEAIGRCGDEDMLNVLQQLSFDGPKIFPAGIHVGAAKAGNIHMLPEEMTSLYKSLLFELIRTHSLPKRTIDFMFQGASSLLLTEFFTSAALAGDADVCRRVLQNAQIEFDFQLQYNRVMMMSLTMRGEKDANYFLDLFDQLDVGIRDQLDWSTIFVYFMTRPKSYHISSVHFMIAQVKKRKDCESVFKLMLKVTVEHYTFFEDCADALLAELKPRIKKWSVYWKHLASACLHDVAFEWVCLNCSVKVDDKMAAKCLLECKNHTRKDLSNDLRSAPILRWLRLGAPIKELYSENFIGTLPPTILKLVVQNRSQFIPYFVRLTILYLIREGEYLFVKSIYDQLIKPDKILMAYLRDQCFGSTDNTDMPSTVDMVEDSMFSPSLDRTMDELDVNPFSNFANTVCDTLEAIDFSWLGPLWPTLRTVTKTRVTSEDGVYNEEQISCCDYTNVQWNGKRRLYHWLRKMLLE